MKSTSQQMIVALTLLVLQVSANAQSPPEELLKQMAEQLQKSPTDNTLREKIVKLGAEIKPAPAIPEEAERRMARGAAAFKSATTAADYLDAAKEYEQATLVAPWYGDAYNNLGIVQDKSGNYEAALRSLKLAQLASPGSKEIKALIYEVENRSENAPKKAAIAAAKKAEEEKAAVKKNEQVAITAQTKRFEGNWFRDVFSGSGIKAHLTLSIKHGVDDVWQCVSENLQEGRVYRLEQAPLRNIREVQFTGAELRFRFNTGYAGVDLGFAAVATISEAGNTLKLAVTPLPITADQAKELANWNNGNATVKPWIDEYKRE